MTAEQVKAKYTKRFPDIAEAWLAVIDRELADLMDKSERMTIGAFYAEVEASLARIPRMFDELGIQGLSEELEEAIGEAVIAGLTERKP
jgi:hypothetical protein